MKIELGRAQTYLEWLKQKMFLDRNAQFASKRKVKRGQVYYCDLGIGVGSEENKRRPCVIIQNNVGNINSPNTIVAPITNEPGTPKVTVKIKNRYSYFDTRESKNKELTGFILLGNIVTVSKGRLDDPVTTLTDEMNEVDEKILVSLGLYGEFKNMKEIIKKDKSFIKKKNDEIYHLNKFLELIKKEIGEEKYSLIKDKL